MIGLTTKTFNITRMKRNILLLLVAIAVGSLTLSAQGRRSLRINEVMVQNENDYVDDYGQRGAWIELFNSSFAPLQISSIFITDDPNEPTKYQVPLGDVRTKLHKRSHILFWADGYKTRGATHLNFKLVPGVDNWIGVYDADGITLIDSVTVPASLTADQSYARRFDGDSDGWEIRSSEEGFNPVTPAGFNHVKEGNSKAAMFAEQDEHGFGMAVIAMCVVFSALLLLSVCFYIISKIGERTASSNKAKAQAHTGEMVSTERPSHDSGEEIAAIVMALHDHLDAHDTESTILTINKVKRAYSPWSSKLYNMRQLPHK